jgi:hypothetical protein
VSSLPEEPLGKERFHGPVIPAIAKPAFLRTGAAKRGAQIAHSQFVAANAFWNLNQHVGSYARIASAGESADRKSRDNYKVRME